MRPVLVGIGPRGVARMSALLAWLGLVVGLTVATADKSLPVDALASSPRKIEQGKLWFLLTSGLVVQHPIAISLACFIALAALMLAVCGVRLFWIAAATGHVVSTVLAYGAFATVRAFDPRSFQVLLTSPDYGVSAISAAWLGAIAAAGWRQRGLTTRGRIGIAFAVVAIAVFAYTLRGGLNVLDSDHVIAFAIGVALVAASNRRRASPTPEPASQRLPA